MGVMVQIRNVPPELHRKLKAKAARLGVSLSEFLLGEARRAAETITPEELVERLKTRKSVRSKMSIVEMLREERERD